MFAGALPPAGGNQLVNKAQLDVNHPLVGNDPQPWVVVQDVHVLLGLGLCYEALLLFAHAVVLHLWRQQAVGQTLSLMLGRLRRRSSAGVQGFALFVACSAAS